MTHPPILLRLSEEDRELLDRLHRETGRPRAQLLRWALRHYCVFGPWDTADSINTRMAALGITGELEFGPRKEALS